MAVGRARGASRAMVSLSGVVALGVAVLLAACVPEPPPAPAPTPSATASAAPEPSLDPEGTADDNLAYFTLVLERAVDDGARDGREFVRALESAGFERDAMEVTADTTSVGLEADNIQFAVLIGGGCLVGQYGNVGLQTAALEVLATGRCLVGDTASVG